MISSQFTSPPFSVRMMATVSVIGLFGHGGLCFGGGDGDVGGYLPQPLEKNAFSAIRESSPFRRTILLSDSIVLTGMARIEGEVFATLFDTETTKTHVVSEMTNSQGWQLVGLKGNESDLESLTARIQVEGGEVVSIRYEEFSENGTPGSGSQSRSSKLSGRDMKEAKEAALKYKKGFSSDGYPDEPPSEIVRKLSTISVQQREAINRHMIGLRNQGMEREKRKEIYDQMVDRAFQGRR